MRCARQSKQKKDYTITKKTEGARINLLWDQGLHNAACSLALPVPSAEGSEELTTPCRIPREHSRNEEMLPGRTAIRTRMQQESYSMHVCLYACVEYLNRVDSLTQNTG